MDSLFTIGLLSAQALIMFSLGIGLKITDFQRVLARPFVISVGLLGQLLLLPLMALLTIHLFQFSPMFAAGLMLLSFCPGGVTSNIVSKLSKADVAMSVSLTATLSILSFITVPPLAGWAIDHFLGKDAIEFSFVDLALVTFLVTTTPVLIGVVFRHYFEDKVIRIEPIVEKIAILLWILIVTAALIGSWNTFSKNAAVMGGALLFLPLTLIVVSLATSRLLRLNVSAAKTIAIEVSIQNAPLAIALAATIMGAGGFLTDLALPAAVYSITMYIVIIPFTFVFRRWGH